MRRLAHSARELYKTPPFLAPALAVIAVGLGHALQRPLAQPAPGPARPTIVAIGQQARLIAPIATKDFIAAVAAERNRYALSRHMRQVIDEIGRAHV